ncbi:hypothetical protein [Tepidibacillus sp. LV47]|uniref:hypothetical protein n=1 Tax=Tepidibacillus sp. LV47 TaxID=3398228 RepID=UPI003AABD677
MSDKKKITVLKGYRPLTEEELAAELTPTFDQKVVPVNQQKEEDQPKKVKDGDNTVTNRFGIAFIGVILSILSLFILPYLLAPIGIVLGYLGYRRGDQTVGLWAMGLGAVGLIGTLIMTAIVY